MSVSKPQGRPVSVILEEVATDIATRVLSEGAYRTEKENILAGAFLDAIKERDQARAHFATVQQAHFELGEKWDQARRESRPEDLDTIKRQSDALLAAQENSEHLAEELRAARALAATLQARVEELEGFLYASADHFESVASGQDTDEAPDEDPCQGCDCEAPCDECVEGAEQEPPAPLLDMSFIYNPPPDVPKGLTYLGSYRVNEFSRSGQ